MIDPRYQSEELFGSDDEVKKAKERQEAELRARQRELNDLRIVMSTREGRRFLWRLMGHCQVFGSVMDEGGRIQYNSGRQDVGHFVMDEALEANPTSFLAMMKEANQEAKEGDHAK